MSVFDRSSSKSVEVAGGNVLGNAAGKQLDSIGDAITHMNNNKTALIAQAMQHQHEMEKLHATAGAQGLGVRYLLANLPEGATGFEHVLGDARTKITINPNAKKAEPATEPTFESTPVPNKGQITKHVKDMLAVKANKKATTEDHTRVAHNLGRLYGLYGQKAVDRAIKTHPLIKGA